MGTFNAFKSLVSPGGGFNNSMHTRGYNSRGRGNNTHHQGQHQESGEGWFHPGMLEDPWAELERAREHEQYEQEDPGQSWPHNSWEVTTETEKEEQQMSESMIARWGTHSARGTRGCWRTQKI